MARCQHSLCLISWYGCTYHSKDCQVVVPPKTLTVQTSAVDSQARGAQRKEGHGDQDSLEPWLNGDLIIALECDDSHVEAANYSGEIRSDRDGRDQMQMRSDETGIIPGASFCYTHVSHADKRVSKEFGPLRDPKVISQTPP